MKKYWLVFLSALTLATMTILVHRSIKGSDRQQQPVALDSLVPDAETLLKAQKKGKKSRTLRKIYTKVPIDSLKIPSVNSKFLNALEHQLTFLKNANDEKIGDLEVEVDQLEKVIELLRKAKSPQAVAAAFDAYQIKGANEQGAVKFTGYYSPVIPARRKADAVFKFPVLLAKSSKSDDMTVAFVRDRHDIASVRTEGVAYLQFPDGDRRLVACDGETRRLDLNDDEEETGEDHDLTSMDAKPKKVKTSYTSVFTTQYDKYKPIGAAKVPLTSDVTIAVDPDYIPLGAVVLAEVPILDEQGNLVRLEPRLLLAQDTGGKIQGTGHVDLYMGEGDAAKKRIKNMSKYGRLWLLLPKNGNRALAQNL
jgi:membrane-bound lytic murein transglycosylase A